MSSVISASMCKANRPGASSNFLDAQYFDDIVAQPFRDGTISEAPVMPGTGMFMPSGSAAVEGQGLVPPRRTGIHRRSLHRLHGMHAGLSGCRNPEHGARHPRAARPSRSANSTSPRRKSMRCANRCLRRATRVREIYRRSKEPKPFHEIVAAAAEKLDIESAIVQKNLGKLAAALGGVPGRQDPAVLRRDGEGGSGLGRALFRRHRSLEMLGLSGMHRGVRTACAVERQQDARCWRPPGAVRVPEPHAQHAGAFLDGATKPDGETKRLMLDRNNYYATTGGHGACRGCGEVTAIRMVTSTNHAIHERRRKDHTKRSKACRQAERQTRHGERAAGDPSGANASRPSRRWKSTCINLESGPTGNGPAATVIANATGCSSVYASTFPFNPYNDPWVNSLFQDTPAVAKGIFEGLAPEATTISSRCARPNWNWTTSSIRWCTTSSSGRSAGTEFTPEELNHAADRDQHGRRRRDLRHRLRRPVAPPGDLDADQGRGAQQRCLFQHRRAGIDRQPDRPGFRSRPLRRRPFGQAGRPQGTGPDRRVPSQRLRGPDHHRAAGPFPEERHGIPEPQRRPAVLDVYAPCQGEQASPTPPPAVTAAWRSKPHQPGIHPRSAQRQRPAQPLLARRQSGSRQGLDDPTHRIRRRRSDQAVWKCRTPRPISPRRKAASRSSSASWPPMPTRVPVAEYIDLPAGERARKDAVRLCRRTTKRS